MLPPLQYIFFYINIQNKNEKKKIIKKPQNSTIKQSILLSCYYIYTYIFLSSFSAFLCCVHGFKSYKKKTNLLNQN